MVPLLKVTVPVAVEGLTVAVNVTDAPRGELGVPGARRAPRLKFVRLPKRLQNC